MRLEALIEVLQSYVRKDEPTDVFLDGNELAIVYLSDESHRFVFNLKDVRVCLVHGNCTMSSSQGCRIDRANAAKATPTETTKCFACQLPRETVDGSGYCVTCRAVRDSVKRQP